MKKETHKITIGIESERENIREIVDKWIDYNLDLFEEGEINVIERGQREVY